MNCNGISKSDKVDFEKVKISTRMFTHNSQFENLFICKDSIGDFDSGFSKIELNEENIKIVNSKMMVMSQRKLKLLWTKT